MNALYIFDYLNGNIQRFLNSPVGLALFLKHLLNDLSVLIVSGSKRDLKRLSSFCYVFEKHNIIQNKFVFWAQMNIVLWSINKYQKPKYIISSIESSNKLYSAKANVVFISRFPIFNKFNEIQKFLASIKNVKVIIVESNISKNLLLKHPYNIQQPIHVYKNMESIKIPLIKESKYLEITYIGDLSDQSGIIFLCETLSMMIGVHLNILTDTTHKKAQSQLYKIHSILPRHLWNVYYAKDQDEISKVLVKTDVLVSPFLVTAESKIFADISIKIYDKINRPIIAPDIEIVREILSDRSRSLFLFEPESQISLQDVIEKLKDDYLRFMIMESLEYE